ncbi:MAG: hypothetical protein H0U76_25850 [Ktedonobacteraceae bacterium]|nr:hypothetical protein [Ktedonobacteraceae bacterium]
MGTRRSYNQKRPSAGEYLWTIVGLVSLVLFFILLSWLGITGTFTVLGLLICAFFVIRYGWSAYRLHMRSQAPASGFGLTPPDQLRAQAQGQKQPPTAEYTTGYQAQNTARPTHKKQTTGQPKQDPPTDYNQPLIQYPEEM